MIAFHKHFCFCLGAIVSDLSPFDITDENVNDYEETVEKLDAVKLALQNKIYRLKKDVKDRKHLSLLHILMYFAYFPLIQWCFWHYQGAMECSGSFLPEKKLFTRRKWSL